MPRPLSPKQLEALRLQQVEIANRIKAGEKDEKRRHREAELRRETIVGRLVLNLINDKQHGTLRGMILALISQHITKPADRALFHDLPEAERSAISQ